jgi:hypothetical protein
VYVYGPSEFLEEVGEAVFVDFDVDVLAAFLQPLLLRLQLEVQLLYAVRQLLVVQLELESRDLGNVQQTLVHPQ